LYSQRVGRVSRGSGVGNGSRRFGGKRRYESRCCKREAVVSMVPALVELLFGQIWCCQLELEHLHHEIRAMQSPQLARSDSEARFGTFECRYHMLRKTEGKSRYERANRILHHVKVTIRVVHMYWRNVWETTQLTNMHAMGIGG